MELKSSNYHYSPQLYWHGEICQQNFWEEVLEPSATTGASTDLSVQEDLIMISLCNDQKEKRNVKEKEDKG